MFLRGDFALARLLLIQRSLSSAVPFQTEHGDMTSLHSIKRWLPVRGAITLAAGALVATAAWAHGDVTPQAVDTSTLPQLGAKWRDSNPYTEGAAHKEALRIGTSAYNQNCARCHGLEAISGGISPDLRKLDSDCTGLADANKKQMCFNEISEFYAATVRRGRVRDGRVYMPPFEGTLTQEAVWAIKTYLETRREP
jgi:cytochrome c-550 PedF